MTAHGIYTAFACSVPDTDQVRGAMFRVHNDGPKQAAGIQPRQPSSATLPCICALECLIVV